MIAKTQKEKMETTMQKVKYVMNTYDLIFEDACLFLQTHKIMNGIETYEQCL